ncbi:MAG: hypothetical protein ACRD3W_23945, partial [Terriglobales bacterium]
LYASFRLKRKERTRAACNGTCPAYRSSRRVTNTIKGNQMKRTLTMALAMGILALLGFQSKAFAVTATQVQGTGGNNVTCYQESAGTGASNFPGKYFWYCGTSEPSYGGQDFGWLQSQVSNIPSPVNAKQTLMATPVHYFVFTDNNAYQTFCQGSVVSPPGAQLLIPHSECFSTTDLDSTVRGLSRSKAGSASGFAQTVAVENYIDGTTGLPMDQNKITNGRGINGGAMMKFTLLHENGHQVDWAMAGIVQAGASAISNTTLFINLLTDDWNNIIALDSHNTTGDKNGCNLGGSQTFRNQVDNHGDLICNSTGGVNTGAHNGYKDTWNNKQILQKAWPQIYDPTSPGGSRGEEAASVNAFNSGANQGGPQEFPSVGNMDEAYYLPKFACTKFLMQNIAFSGTLPPANQYPPNCAH